MNASLSARFDLSDVCNSRVGVACVELDVTTTRFGACERLSADDRGLLLVVRWDDGSTEDVRPERVTYVDGKVIP